MTAPVQMAWAIAAFVAWLVRLDRAVAEELRPTEEDRRWTSRL